MQITRTQIEDCLHGYAKEAKYALTYTNLYRQGYFTIQIFSFPIAASAASSSIPNTSIKYQSESMIYISISVTIRTHLVNTKYDTSSCTFLPYIR